MVCRSCGAIADVDCAVGAASCLTVSDDNGFQLQEAEVIYWGRCPDCVAAAASFVIGDRSPTRSVGNEIDLPSATQPVPPRNSRTWPTPTARPAHFIASSVVRSNILSTAGVSTSGESGPLFVG